jgi:coenzyme F420 hydrogenase subunit beta
MIQNISEIANSDLCTGCGTCAGVCPTNAIRMVKSHKGTYSPIVDYSNCKSCGLCIEVCPGYSLDFKRLNLLFFGHQPKDPKMGNYLNCYIGHSTDKRIRYNSSSGGMATQLLIFALENDVIDGAIVTRMRKNNPLEPESFIATTKEEIISASKSKYCPVSANLVLRDILNENGKFAIVGLPCHIQGIRKAELINRKLLEKVILHVGLLCSHTVNFAGTEFLLKKIGIKKSEVSKLDYRGGGWPGSLSVHIVNDTILSMPLIGDWNSYWPIFSSFFFTPMRCLMCPDEMNELSDVSLGDAWLPELRYEKIGESLIITRTKIAEEILTQMKSMKAISIRHVDVKKAIESQALNLVFKKRALGGRLSLLKLLGKSVPSLNSKPRSSLALMLGSLLPYLNTSASSNRYLKSMMLKFPLPIFRFYWGLLKTSLLLSNYLRE